MSPDLKRRIQDVSVGTVVGALAVGLTIWRDVSLLKRDMAYVQRDLNVLAQFFKAQYPGWVGDLTTPPKQEPEP